MTDSPLSRRLFIAKAAPLIAATAMPADIAGDFYPKLGESPGANAVDPIEHMRAIICHFAGLASDGADRIMLQVGGTPDSFGYVAHAFFSSWVPDARLRLYRDEAAELARACVPVR